MCVGHGSVDKIKIDCVTNSAALESMQRDSKIRGKKLECTFLVVYPM